MKAYEEIIITISIFKKVIGVKTERSEHSLSEVPDLEDKRHMNSCGVPPEHDFRSRELQKN